MIKEVWKEIPDYPGYKISNLGRVWSEKTNRLRKLHTQTQGYWHVVLSNKNKTKTIRLSRLVLTVFVGEPPSEKHQAAHIDGNKDNNTIENLYWATPFENAADRQRHGNYFSDFDHPMAKLSHGDLVFAKWLRSIGWKWVRIAEEVGVTADTISRRVRNLEASIDGT